MFIFFQPTLSFRSMHFRNLTLCTKSHPSCYWMEKCISCNSVTFTTQQRQTQDSSIHIHFYANPFISWQLLQCLLNMPVNSIAFIYVHISFLENCYYSKHACIKDGGIWPIILIGLHMRSVNEVSGTSSCPICQMNMTIYESNQLRKCIILRAELYRKAILSVRISLVLQLGGRTLTHNHHKPTKILKQLLCPGMYGGIVLKVDMRSVNEISGTSSCPICQMNMTIYKSKQLRKCSLGYQTCTGYYVSVFSGPGCYQALKCVCSTVSLRYVIMCTSWMYTNNK